ncbi:cytochrome c [Candidatus Pelagibacter sp. Uisw_099_02]|uniref:c-type cytochrome n=1 Tax=Candidatus Pelagibacter sp. Uisw_099_02 TaxID=3230981 RepID=UPI0039E9E281
MKTLLIIISFIFINQISYAHFHFPITRDSTLMIARGKIIYENNCVSCHQVNLVGAENWKDLDEDGHRKAPPLNGAGHTWHHDDATLHNIIKYGLAKLVKNYEGKMIGFGDKINDKQIDSVLSYIKSHWDDEIYERQISISK